MSEFEFRFDWLGTAGCDNPVIDRTMANLGIHVQGECVTAVLDKCAKTTRSTIVTPLYPLAEWIASHWWPLLHECQVRAAGKRSDEYGERHAIRNAAEGFALPDLRICPEGEFTRVEWNSVRTQHQTVDLLAGGTASVRSAVLSQALADFVEAVTSRLRLVGITNSWLQDEWTAIRQTPSYEAEFCMAAAWLGLDPYDLDETTAHYLESIWTTVPSDLREDFLRAGNAETLSPSVEWLRGGMEAIRGSAAADRNWRLLRERVPQVALEALPWQEGYRFARELRNSMRLEEPVPFRFEDLVQGELPIISAAPPPLGSLDGLMGATEASVPYLYTAKRRRDSQRFVFARGLLDFIFGTRPCSAVLLTTAISDRQQRGRAFAAELLAPARLIQTRLNQAEVTEEKVEDLASEFEVSSYVIEHQIRNHRLARLVDSY